MGKALEGKQNKGDRTMETFITLTTQELRDCKDALNEAYRNTAIERGSEIKGTLPYGYLTLRMVRLHSLEAKYIAALKGLVCT